MLDPRQGAAHAAVRGTLIAVICGSAVSVAASAGVYEYRAFDGHYNNPMPGQSDWGAAHHTLRRVSGSAYANGRSIPSGQDRPNPRLISNIVHSASPAPGQPQFNPHSVRGLTDMVWQWGQFLDHDLDLTIPGSNELMAIPVPAGDLWFDPQGFGNRTLPMRRSSASPGTGVTTPREQINALTAFIDASHVYGTENSRASALRAFQGGRMLITPHATGDLLPFNFMNIDNDNGPIGGPNAAFFVAGDIRANEQSGLAAMHTLFVREHNYWAGLIQSANPALSDEEIFQRARKIVGAMMQIITYNEFIPELLGPNALPAYSGYEPQMKPMVANEFSAALFRIGHTMLSDSILRLEEDGEPILQGPLSLRSAFFKPGIILDEGGIEPILRGLAAQHMREVDRIIIDDVRNLLFNINGTAGQDLASLNIQRGRDHGLPDYNTVRQAYGLSPKASFNAISSDAATVNALRQAYGTTNGQDNVHLVDLWTGALCEDHVPGASVGELMLTGLVEQFVRVREGDRFWYQNDAALAPILGEIGLSVADLEGRLLSHVIRDNTSIENIGENVFSLIQPPVLCEGDADGSGQVDVDDLAFIVLRLGQSGGPADVDGSGSVDVDDLTYAVLRLGSCGEPR